jgi:hypothetical protein
MQVRKRAWEFEIGAKIKERLAAVGFYQCASYVTRNGPIGNWGKGQVFERARAL